MTVAIIGLGLIGGSAAIDLKKRGFASRVLGVDNNPLHEQTALRMGIVDECLPLEQAVAEAQIVVLAVPVGAALRLLPQVLDLVEQQVVTDMCSTKEGLALAVKYHPKRKRYVAAHPMAGTEHSGPWAALSNLFDSKAVILCDVEESAPDALALVRQLFATLNLREILMRSSHHDVHAAYVSHVSHAISFALALTVLAKEKDEKHIFDLASGGFASTARLAKSSADMWVPIFLQNRENMLAVMDTYAEQLGRLRQAIDAQDEQALHQLVAEANRIKRVLS